MKWPTRLTDHQPFLKILLTFTKISLLYGIVICLSILGLKSLKVTKEFTSTHHSSAVIVST